MARLRLSGSRFEAIGQNQLHALAFIIHIKPLNLNFLSDTIAVEAFSLGEMIIVHSTFFRDRK